MTTIRPVNGMTIKSDSFDMLPTIIEVRVTADKRGKTLSLCDGETMLVVPVEPLKGLVEVTEGD